MSIDKKHIVTIVGILIYLQNTIVVTAQEGITVVQENVGIGTTTPTTTLEILDNVSSLHIREATPASASQPIMDISAGASGSVRMGAISTTDNSFGGAVIQAFSSASPSFKGQIYLDAGSDPASDIFFRTALQPRMVVKQNGNIGIGVIDPSQKLEISGNILMQNLNHLLGKRSDGFAHQMVTLDNNNSVVINRSSIVNNLPSNLTMGVGENKFLSVINSSFQTLFLINEANKYVGVGTSAPTAKLEVFANPLAATQGSSVRMARIKSTTTNQDNLDLTANRKTAGETWHSAALRLQRVVDVTKMGYLEFGLLNTNMISLGYGETEYLTLNHGGLLRLKTSGQPMFTLMDERGGADDKSMVILTDAAQALTKRSLVIQSRADNGGFQSNLLIVNDEAKVGVGREPINYQLEVNGSASKTTAGSWLGNSDARLKKNITQLNGEKLLSDLLKIKGVQYNWREDGKDYNARPTGTNYGLIAQDIQKVFPSEQFVQKDSDGYLSAAYGTYDPIYIEVIRHLTERIEELEKVVMEMREERRSNKIILQR